jgi:hypothetical protein
MLPAGFQFFLREGMRQKLSRFFKGGIGNRGDICFGEGKINPEPAIGIFSPVLAESDEHRNHADAGIAGIKTFLCFGGLFFQETLLLVR